MAPTEKHKRFASNAFGPTKEKKEITSKRKERKKDGTLKRWDDDAKWRRKKKKKEKCFSSPTRVRLFFTIIIAALIDLLAAVRLLSIYITEERERDIESGASYTRKTQP